MTRRADRQLPSLTAEERHACDAAALQTVGRVWLEKSRSELSASTAFAEVHRCLVLLGAPHDLLASSARAIDDELRHASICRSVAEQFLGQALPWPQVERAANNADFRGCTETESALLYVATHCGLSEGVACGYLKSCHAAAQTELVRAATRELLADEVQHCRIFWRLLPTRSDGEKRLLAEALPTLLYAVHTEWTKEDPLHAACPAGYGTLDQADLEHVVHEVFRSVVIPGFRAAGIDTTRVE